MNNAKRLAEKNHALRIRARDSAFNTEANAILDDLRDVAERIRRLLDADHGDTCKCDFCSSEAVANPEGVLHDLSGIAWALETATGCLDGMLLTTEEKKQAMLSEMIAEGKQA